MDFERMLRYCALLEQNNNRTWFHENHKLYEQAKADFTELTEQVKYRVADHCGPELAQRLLYANAKDLLYRVPRDARVWRNAPPYNPSWRAYIAGDKHSMWPVGYYYMIAPGNRSEFGTGAWCPDTQWLRRVRGYISANFSRFAMALAESGYALSGDRLKRVPAGFDALDPAGEYLRYKEWFISESFADTQLRDFDSFLDRVAAAVERMEPLRLFFDDAFAQKIRSPWEADFDGE